MLNNTELETEIVEDFKECFKNIKETSLRLRFYFSDEAQQLGILRNITDQFVTEVNDTIREGKVPPRSKPPELVPKTATVFHVFNHAMTELLADVLATLPTTETQKSEEHSMPPKLYTHSIH